MPPMPPMIDADPISPVRVFAAAFSLSSFAGLVAHLREQLREGKPLQWVAGVVATLASGCMGASITMIWYWKFQDNIFFLVGAVFLASLGGRPVVDAVTTETPAIIRRMIARWFGAKSPEDHHGPDPLQPPHETRDPK